MSGIVDIVCGQAETVMRQAFRQQPQPGINPVIELIGQLLADDTGELRPAAALSLTTAHWHQWNQLVLDQPTLINQQMSDTLEQEKVPLPSDPPNWLPWAIWLVASVLDRLEA